jgi:DNA-binding PadR family transcriptional regulator
VTGVLEMAILGLLKEQPMHGYDLRKRLRSDFGLLASLSFGSLYPALARLEGEGAVREQEHYQAAPPTDAIAFTGSLAGERAAFRARLAARAISSRAGTTGTNERPGGSGTRGRKIYELTPRGAVMFERLLTEEQPREDARAFALRWAFARHLSPEERASLLARRRRELEERLSLARRAADSPPRPLDRFERSLVEHSNAAVQLDLDWIDRLIASESAARQPQPTAPATANATATNDAGVETEVSRTPATATSQRNHT